jgi:ADP-ribose pyrophosphatase YjhB (NUDIX family)
MSSDKDSKKSDGAPKEAESAPASIVQIMESLRKKHGPLHLDVVVALQAAYALGKSHQTNPVPSSGILRAGAWIFSPELDSVLLVQSKSGDQGPPKGRFEACDGTDINARDREVKEETGLLPKDLKYLGDHVFVDVEKKGQAEMRLWVAVLKNKTADFQPEKTSDVSSARMVPIKMALAMLQNTERAQSLIRAEYLVTKTLT